MIALFRTHSTLYSQYPAYLFFEGIQYVKRYKKYCVLMRFVSQASHEQARAGLTLFARVFPWSVYNPKTTGLPYKPHHKENCLQVFLLMNEDTYTRGINSLIEVKPCIPFLSERLAHNACLHRLILALDCYTLKSSFLVSGSLKPINVPLEVRNTNSGQCESRTKCRKLYLCRCVSFV